MGDKKRSGWFYVFVGCGLLMLVGVILVGVGTFLAVRWGQDLKQGLEDPATRTAGAKELLGAAELPAGYHAAVHIRFPMGLGRMVVLTDGKPTDKPDSLGDSDHLFIYMEGPGWDSDWKAFAAGGEPPFDNLDELGIQVDGGQRLSSGDFTSGNMEVFYATHRGGVSGEHFDSDDGVFAIALVRCMPGDGHSRTILWAGPPPADDAEDRVKGTTGDPERIRGMLGKFSLCG